MIRPFNTFGPRQSARAVIPTIITQIAAGQREIGSARCIRRATSVLSPTPCRFISAAEAVSAVGEVINLGSNFEISIGDTAQLIAERMDADITIVSDDQRLRPPDSGSAPVGGQQPGPRPAGLAARIQGPGRIRRALGETIDWFVQPDNLRQYKAPALQHLTLASGFAGYGGRHENHRGLAQPRHARLRELQSPDEGRCSSSPLRPVAHRYRNANRLGTAQELSDSADNPLQWLLQWK